ncbi:MAG: carboxy terminal-processing peptidase [Saprospiraceae bacterium]|nr:carboxy terminal-processing peptidase [Saprospiraceae bacterium]
MNSKKAWTLIIPSLIFILLFNANCKTVSDSLGREQLILQILYKQSQQFHYSPVKVDDEFSKKVFLDFLDNMDSGKRFLTKKDINSLEQYKTSQDEFFKEGRLDFFNKFSLLFMESLSKTESFYKEILNTDLFQAKDETIIVDAEKRDWASDDKELKEQWRKNIQYDFNNRYYDALDVLEKDKKTRPKDSIATEIINDIRESYDTYFDNLKKSKDAERFEVYANTFLHIYDPHTEYFSPKDKENFNINMAGKLEGIGARLQTDKEFTKVSSIVPGGPAWKQKELEANDIIIAVKQEEGEFVDIKGMNIDDVVKKVRGKKGTKVTLKVKKASNEVKEIMIVRDEVILDEGIARSALLKSDSTSDKIGYIRLPKFYAELESPNGVSCARDVTKELKKLQSEGAKSLVLDLRNNGGGSLQEVVEMAGLFFKNGTVVQVKDKERVTSYNDTDEGIVFDGPIVVMINNNSASASEILAACLQDYKRAVIVGGNRSFGKGSVQRFVNLDRINGYDNLKPLGELKITIQKYYRVSGGSVQLKGVEPDVKIPDIYQYLDNGEKEYDYPLKYDVISSNATAKIEKPIVNLDEIVEKSKERVKSMNEFNIIDQQAQLYKTMKDDVLFPLDYQKFKTKLDNRKAESKKYEELSKNQIANMIALNLEADMPYINLDSSRVGRNEDFLKNIRKDLHILESLNVLKDIKN